MLKITQQSLANLALVSTLFCYTPGFVFADTTVTTPTTTTVPYLTSVYGNITIAAAGSLTNTGGTQAITTDTSGAVITVDPNNTTSAALSAASAADISISNTGAVITIGAGSTITGLFNIAAQAGSSGSVLVNNGTMTATSTSIAINSGSSFSSITNGGIINAGGNAILAGGLLATSITGDIVNTGTINAAGGNVISLTNTTMSGQVNNSGSMNASSSVISIDGTSSIVGGILNSGSMIATTGDTIIAQMGAILGPITNSGTITANGASNAINLGAVATNVLITNNAPGIITGNVIVSNDASGGGTVLQMNGGTINGTVIATAGAGPSRTFNVTGGTITGGINLSASVAAFDFINQSGGTVGNILGSALNSHDTYTVTGPVTTGGNITRIPNIIVPGPGVLTNNNIISGVVNFQVQTGGSVINNGQILPGISPTALTVTGASNFTNNSTGLVDLDSITVSDPGSVFTNSGSIATGTLTVQNGAFYEEAAGSTGANMLIVNSGSTYKADVGGTTTVPGTVSINNSTYEVQIQDPTHFGQIVVSGAGVSNITNSIVKVDLVNCSHFFLNGEMYPIIHDTGAGTITHSFSIQQPSSPTVQFVDASTNKDVILEVVRTPFAGVAGLNAITIPPAMTIDALIASGQILSPTFEAFIIALDNLSAECMNEALSTLVPQFDGGLVNLTRLLERTIFDGLGKYIDEHRPITCLIPCYAAGDVGMGRWGQTEFSRGTWVKGFATRVLQRDNDLTQGYDLEDIGIILGYDQYCSDRVVLGAALSYATANINSRDPSLDTQSAKSFQITVYSTYDYEGPGYLDVMAAIAFNNYESTRNIIAGSFLAESDAEFDAWNYAVNAEWGYRFSYGKYRLIPNLRALYSRLQIDNYTESGADGLSLSVSNQPVEAGITTIGFKLNTTEYYGEAGYVTEARFNVVYDWINDGQTMTSFFLEGGPPFITNAIKPHPCIYNIGLSFTALACTGVVFVIDGEVDLQRDYSAYSLSAKFRWEW